MAGGVCLCSPAAAAVFCPTDGASNKKTRLHDRITPFDSPCYPSTLYFRAAWEPYEHRKQYQKNTSIAPPDSKQILTTFFVVCVRQAARAAPRVGQHEHHRATLADHRAGHDERPPAAAREGDSRGRDHFLRPKSWARAGSRSLHGERNLETSSVPTCQALSYD